MIVTSPAGPDTVRATFRLQHVVDCHEICLVGEFNDWSPTANPMTFNGHGYTAEIVIPTGRSYRFRYLIDNERWHNDWAADSYVPNEFGGDDSVLDLTKPRESGRLCQRVDPLRSRMLTQS
jgi:1,4-alpha-glucan branching enzyme